ncbi:hypothetical protein ACQKKK_15215 [Peribacillus sp. NPDC006672]|uniref:hypothetical protein n=1 Tax=Peribacillus sp. NPDC006672 TaxID=3390606 RepID=UPI003D053981
MDNSQKKVFIVTPIGGDNTDIRRAAEGVIDAVIIPRLIEAGFNEGNISVAHRISTAGSINKQLITRIIEDDLVIANLTKLNPNVMYELAIRHAIRKPVIQICENGTKLPFDIVDERTIFYSNDMQGVLELGEGLKKYIFESLKDDQPDNPIYRAIESQMIIQQSPPSEINVNKYLIERLDSIENVVSNLNNSSFQNNRKNEMLIQLELDIGAIKDVDPIEINTDISTILRDYGYKVGKASIPSGNLEVGKVSKFLYYLHPYGNFESIISLRELETSLKVSVNNDNYRVVNVRTI